MPRPATPPAAAARKAALARMNGREQVTSEYPLILTSATAAAAKAAQDAFLHAEAAGDADALKAATARLDEAMTALRDDTIVMTFQALPRAVFRLLMAEHPATDEQQAEAEKAGARRRWNPDTFPDALIAATCTFPGFDSVEQAAAFLSSPDARVSPEEADEIFATALQTCESSRQVADWGKGSGETAS